MDGSRFDHEFANLRNQVSEFPPSMLAAFEGFFTVIRAEATAIGVTLDESAIRAIMLGFGLSQLPEIEEMGRKLGADAQTVVAMILASSLDPKDLT